MAVLPVDWESLRRRLGVARIDDLWTSGTEASWRVVAEAEVEAAGRARAVGAVLEALSGVQAFGVLTSNSERAVRRFLEAHEELVGRLAALVGRETLGGPKRDPQVFRAGYRACVAATRQARGEGPVIYVGDSSFELDFAGRLGAVALPVAALPDLERRADGAER